MHIEYIVIRRVKTYIYIYIYISVTFGYHVIDINNTRIDISLRCNSFMKNEEYTRPSLAHWRGIGAELAS